MNCALEKVTDPFVRLFWKTQISALRGCPPLVGVVSGFSTGAANSSGLWFKTLFRVAAQAPHALLQNGRDKAAKRIVLPRVTIIVTTRCTLNCDKCIAHVPYQKKHHDIPSDDLCRDIRALLACVDFIYVVCFSGGEPFLHPSLDEFLRICADSGKVGNISIATNGTIFPDTKTLAALRETKATVKISKYAPALQPDAEKLKAVLQANGIHCSHESCTAWSDTRASGQLKEGSAKRRFSVCVQQLCTPYYDGKLYVCSQSVALMPDILPDCKEDYIDLQTIDPVDFHAQWRKLQEKNFVSACSYCLGDTYKSPKVPVAEQVPKATQKETLQ